MTTTVPVPANEQGYDNAGTSGFWLAPEQPEETPELRWPASVKIYDAMRRQDAQVISVLRAVKLPITRTRWWVDPAGADPEVVESVADNLGLPIKGQPAGDPPLRSRDRFSWNEHLRHALLSLEFGHSFFEQVYRPPERGGDGRARLRKLAWRPPRTISQIDVAEDGGLVAIRQHGVAGKPDVKIERDRLVAYVNEREGGNWLGQSLLRPAYKFWVLKDRLLRVQAQTVDRNGLGVPKYTGAPPSENPSLTAEELQALAAAELKAGLALARQYRSGNNAGISVPHGADFELLGVSGDLPDADSPIRYYDEQIARAVLAHFLNLGTETGSWALGSTFADFFTLSLEAVALHIDDVATSHIVEDLVDLNFGTEVRAPRIVHEEIGSRHPATAEAIKMLIDCRALVPDANLEAHLRTGFGLPEADPGTARPVPVPGAVVKDDAAVAREAAEVAQKAYLSVDVLLDREEARDLVKRAGAEIKPADLPEPPPPPPAPPADDPDEQGADQ